MYDNGFSSYNWSVLSCSSASARLAKTSRLRRNLAIYESTTHTIGSNFNSTFGAQYIGQRTLMHHTTTNISLSLRLRDTFVTEYLVLRKSNIM